MVDKKIKNKISIDAPVVTGALPAVTENVGADIFPVVGIGASAGGLAAFESFFSGMPAGTDPDMAFVLVQHLAPDHKSLLSEIIQRFTRMQVFEVEDGMVVQKNCAYIIPPNRDMAFLNGTLQLLEPIEPRGHRMAIDFFFRSLAEDQEERAIGVVLSGAGSDGTMGLRAIKDGGGMVMTQDPESTEFDSMPRSAIATGLVDYVLPPAQMAAQLISYVKHAFGRLQTPMPNLGAKGQNAFKKIFLLLRTNTGHDFSHYKPSSIARRIGRRMAVHQIDELDDYVRYLQHNSLEVQALFRELLIGVTNFFRDPKAFKSLEDHAIPGLFSDKSAGAPIRVWVAGCSTGEEAYSIAMLLQEQMDRLKKNYVLQVFATDIDSRAIATARSGIYPASIAADLTSERLARFFTAEPDSDTYRIRKSIRDMLIFSEQDLVKDPPFSKLDMISCRNLMIYLDADLQKKLIPLFHFALKPGGLLFLGTSEGVGEFDDLFGVIDRESKLYQRKEDLLGSQRSALTRSLDLLPRLATARNQNFGKISSPAKQALQEITEHVLLRGFAPPGALVNEQGDILYVHGRAGMFLELAPGVAGINNVFKMARDGLRPGLSTTLHRAIESHKVEYCPGLQVKADGQYTTLNLTVLPVSTQASELPESTLFVVALENVTSPIRIAEPVSAGESAAASGTDNHAQKESRIVELQQQLQARDEYIHATQKELETSTEELKSFNEEMQSINEELQSTNEELETSKEELQSVNEELATVNAELQTKVIDLSRANNDMNNLLAGTGIGTIFVDHQLRILRFTPAASSIINLIQSDVGRPVGHLVSNLTGYDRLVADVQSVLNTLVPKEIEVQTKEGKWYAMRMQPYRTLDNVIEGAVISFINITEAVRVREALSKANAMLSLSVAVRDAQDAISVQDMDGRILAWNPRAVQLYGWSEAEALGMKAPERIPEAMRVQELDLVHKLAREKLLEPYRTKRLCKNGAVVEVQMIATALLNDAGVVYATATTERPIAV